MKVILSYLLIILFLPVTVQEMKVDSEKTQLTIFGTSSIHDWEIEAENCSGTAEVVFEEGKFSSIKELTFKVAVASLESGKSAMNDNTVEALKGEKFPYITYKLGEIQAGQKVGDKMFFNTKGTLTIAGASKQVNMEVAVAEENNSILISGEINLKMTDFKVDPPTAIFGTITTGDAIKIQFKTNYIH